MDPSGCMYVCGGTSTHQNSTIEHSARCGYACQVYDLLEGFGAQQIFYANAGYAELHPRAHVCRQVIEENHLLHAAETRIGLCECSWSSALCASIYLLFIFFFFDAYQEGNTTSSLNFSQVRSLSLSRANLWTAHTTRSRSWNLWTAHTTRSWCLRHRMISGGADTQRPRGLGQTSVRRWHALRKQNNRKP